MTPRWLSVQLLRRGEEREVWGTADGRAFLNEDTVEMVSLREVCSIELCVAFTSLVLLVLLCWNRKGEIEQEALKTKQARNLMAGGVVDIVFRGHYSIW